MELSSFFHFGPLPQDALSGYYSLPLVALSYLIASLASYVALDITERIRTSENSLRSKLWWLVGGALAMGMGIWTMHFIGMLAFIMPMPMSYDPFLTLLSLFFAVVVSAFALFLIKNEQVRPLRLMAGGVLLGIGIAAMHYTGMSAMEGMEITYVPRLFILSIAIAMFASEAALWLMIRSTKPSISYRNTLKVVSSLVMGLAICGMHYTGMEAAVFRGDAVMLANEGMSLDPNTLSLYIGTMTIVIISIALFASKSWANALQAHNKKLIATEAILESLNKNLKRSVDELSASEGRIRAILTAAGDGIVVVDDAGTIEIANHAAEKILGWRAEELITQSIFRFLPLAARIKDGYPQSLATLMACEEEEVLHELKIVQKEGKEIPIELNFSCSTISDKVLYIIVMRDITERKRAEEKYNTLNKRLISTARLAGMTEVAACMLHNVGNVLNSINVTTQILLQRMAGKQENVEELKEVLGLLGVSRDKKELDRFLAEHRVGQILPEYLSQFADYWENENKSTHTELESLNGKLQHIKTIVSMQQSLCGNTSTLEPIKINELIDDALTINSEKIEKYAIRVVKEYGNIPLFECDKVKVLQTVVNLIKNAVEAIEEMGRESKILIVRTQSIGNEYVQVEVKDNGIGIAEENLQQIFSYGFTTKKDGHGFGLHSSAVSIQQLGGSIKAQSNGKDQGATFILLLPTVAKREIKDNFEVEQQHALF